MSEPPVAYLLVGLPGSGKTTRARELEREHRAIRFTPDEWMIPLFGDSDAGGKRDVLEGRMIRLGLRALEVGTSVVLDFGFWGRDERSAVRALAQSVGAGAEVVYLSIHKTLQWQRVRERFATTPQETFPVNPADLDSWRALFDEPDRAEIAGTALESAPPEWASWEDYAFSRWPSLGSR